MIAALYVQKGGAYWNLPGVDPWDETRDARLYAGPYPVVAHPPCARWCVLAGLVEAVYGYKKGDDGGTFAAALAAVRKWGGVLEHPAYSAAFVAHGLTPAKGAWQRTMCGGWVCHVEQWHYGHPARKPTWLYAFGVVPPSMRWGPTPKGANPAYVTDGRGETRDKSRKSLDARRASATPVAFRDLLIAIAESVTFSGRKTKKGKRT